MDKAMKLGIYNFIKEVNPDYAVKFQKYDLECDIFDETIYVGESYDKRTDRYFANFVNQLNPECSKVNSFLLSLLHEIGHIETYTEEDEDDKDMKYAILEMQYNDEEELSDERLEEYCDMYFRIPLEQNATEWGIDYALSHLDLMQKYDWLHN